MSTSERVRHAIPVRAVPAIARTRARWALRDPAVRRRSREHMELLLGVARPDVDLDRAARDFTRFYLGRPELHRHPEALHDQEVLGTEHLRAAAALGRGVVLHFLHHGLYEASVTSLALHGLVDGALVEPDLLRDDLTGSRGAYARALAPVRLHSTDVGFAGMIELLGQGQTVAMATDRPGGTEVTFCGRTLWSSSGAARIATMADAPVVALTAERLSSGRVVGRLHPSVLPAEVAGPEALLQRLLDLHEPTVLRWPEAYVFPLDCWGTQPPAPRAPRAP